MNRTNIEYLDFTWNPKTGCDPSGRKGCDHCWSRESHDRRHRAYLAGKRMPVQYEKPFSEIQLFPERLDDPLRRKKPARIGVCFTSDLFHVDVPLDFIEDVLAVITRCPQHTFLLLTKRVYRLPILTKDNLRISRTDSWPIKNLWLGTSISTQDDADRNLPLLSQTPAALRWISYEPALGPVNFCAIPDDSTRTAEFSVRAQFPKIDWVVCGAESSTGARYMDPEWARSVRDQCKAAGVPFFMKQMSGREPIPEDLMVKEFPK